MAPRLFLDLRKVGINHIVFLLASGGSCALIILFIGIGLLCRLLLRGFGVHGFGELVRRLIQFLGRLAHGLSILAFQSSLGVL